MKIKLQFRNDEVASKCIGDVLSTQSDNLLETPRKLLLVQRPKKSAFMFQIIKNRRLRDEKVYKAPNLTSGEMRKWMEIIAYHLNSGARKRRDRFWNLNVGNPSQIRAIISPVYVLVVCMASKWVHLTYKKNIKQTQLMES